MYVYAVKTKTNATEIHAPVENVSTYPVHSGVSVHRVASMTPRERYAKVGANVYQVSIHGIAEKFFNIYELVIIKKFHFI